MADDIVGDRVHKEFALDHVWRAATQDFHSEEGLQFAEVQLDSPTLEVEFPKSFEGVNFRLEEGGDDEAALGSEAFGSKMDFNNADGGNWGSVFIFIQNTPRHEATPAYETRLRTYK